MFDFKCKFTTFFPENQIFTAFGANNSIKVDKTRYNSISGLSDFVNLHRQTDPMTKLTLLLTIKNFKKHD